HTRLSRDWSADVCSSDLHGVQPFEVGEHLFVAYVRGLLPQLAPEHTLEHQGQKTDHDVPADAGLRPVKHRPQLKGGLERTEGARSEERRAGKGGEALEGE